MSILSERSKTIAETSIDGVFVIYGGPGTGKTVLASTFPKSKEKPMLILDILEGGTGSISSSHSEHVRVVDVNTFLELNSILTDVENGYTVNEKNEKIPVAFSTIVFDSATQLEFLMKKYLMESNQKDTMNLNLWGQARTSHEQIWNLAKYLHKKTGALIVIIAHQKEIQDDENSSFNKVIPSLMNGAAYALCAKASFVWYTKVETEKVIDTKTNEVKDEIRYFTYLDAHPYLLTKTRKPQELSVPAKVQNLTYDKFKKNVLDKLTEQKVGTDNVKPSK
jgi:hypothetical protein